MKSSVPVRSVCSIKQEDARVANQDPDWGGLIRTTRPNCIWIFHSTKRETWSCRKWASIALWPTAQNWTFCLSSASTARRSSAPTTAARRTTAASKRKRRKRKGQKRKLKGALPRRKTAETYLFPVLSSRCDVEWKRDGSDESDDGSFTDMYVTSFNSLLFTPLHHSSLLSSSFWFLYPFFLFSLFFLPPLPSTSTP